MEEVCRREVSVGLFTCYDVPPASPMFAAVVDAVLCEHCSSSFHWPLACVASATACMTALSG